MVTGRDVRGRSRAKYSNYVLDKVQDRLVPFLLREKVEEEFVRPTRNFFLYGEHRIGLLKENDDLIITEGPMDVLKLYEYGYYAVGIMGSSPSDRQISTLIEIKPPKGRLVIMADADKAGRRLSKELLSRLGGLPIVEAILPEGHDPGDSSRSEIDFSLENAKKP
jgi:DNA primase